MNLSQLRAIVAVAHHKNFSEAALKLNLNQSSISHAIATLEEELGVPLFIRGRHGATVTPAGERITGYARQILQLIDQIEIEADLQKSLHGGQVRIMAFRSVATHLLPKLIAQFRTQFPAVEIQLIEASDDDSILQGLRDRRADIGFVILPISDEFDTWEIVKDEYVVLLPPNSPIQYDHCPTWEELVNQPLILPPAEYVCDVSLYKHLETFAPPLHIAHKINQDSTIVSMVMQGLGVAILPQLAAEPIPAGVRVCRLPIPFERVIGAAILSDALHIPAVFAFFDMLKQFYRH